MIMEEVRFHQLMDNIYQPKVYEYCVGLLHLPKLPDIGKWMQMQELYEVC